MHAVNNHIIITSLIATPTHNYKAAIAIGTFISRYYMALAD